MRINVIRVFGLLVLCGAGLAFATSAQAAPQCVDPNLCPIIICPPGWTFVDTTCKQCAHCVAPKKGKGRGGGEEPISAEAPNAGESPIDLAPAADEFCTEGESEKGSEVAGKKPRGCKPCSKDRRWCSCSYNGIPRISCDPCCYDDDTTPLPICLD